MPFDWNISQNLKPENRTTIQHHRDATQLCVNRICSQQSESTEFHGLDTFFAGRRTLGPARLIK